MSDPRTEPIKWQTLAEIAARFESIPVARVERFMRDLGFCGIGHRRRWRESDDTYEHSPGVVRVIVLAVRSHGYALKPELLTKNR